MKLLIFIVLLFICLTWIYTRQSRYQGQDQDNEGYMDYIGTQDPSPDGLGLDLAVFGQGLPLADVLVPRTTPGLTALDAASCANLDPARQLELGGQYVQRTNNYRRTYPDSCSSPLTDFVGSIYEPGTMAASDVPCPGT